MLSPQHGWRCLVLFPFKHSSRCPDVSLTTPGFIATNKAENCTAVSLRTPIKNAAFSNPIAKNLHSVTLPNGETTVPCLQPWSVAYQTWSSVTPPPSSSPPGHKHVTWYIACDTHTWDCISGSLPTFYPRDWAETWQKATSIQGHERYEILATSRPKILSNTLLIGDYYRCHVVSTGGCKGNQ